MLEIESAINGQDLYGAVIYGKRFRPIGFSYQAIETRISTVGEEQRGTGQAIQSSFCLCLQRCSFVAFAL